MKAPDTRPVLALPSRQRVFDEVLANPGISMTALARRTGLNWGTLAFHVARLVSAGLVRTFRAGRQRLLIATSHLDRAWPEARALLIEPACRKVALAILEFPGMRVPDVCARTGLSERAVYHHVKRLLDAGLVITREMRHYRGLEATAKLYAVLADAA